MARVSDNWERLVRATLKREQIRASGQGHERIPSGIAGAVPPSLGKATNIDAILQAADAIQAEDANVSRILCEQAYSMAQNLVPTSDGRGVLQFKTGLMSVIKRYKRRHRLEDIQREEQRLRESGTFSANFGELEVALLLIVYIAYGYTDGGAVSYFLLTLSSWFLVISWLFAPYIFNPSGFEWQKTVEDFDDWTSWLLYKGGVGVKGENSWESWWDEEQMHIQTLRGRILETILSLRFFLFQYGIVYKLHLTGKDTSLAIYGFSWVVLITIVMIFKVFTFNHKKSAKFQLVMRFTQSVTSLGLVAAIVLLVVFTRLSIADLFACLLAIIPTGWAILCLAITWKRIVKSLGLWDSVREFARMYDAGMGMLIFSPIAFLSWFPFISTFQSRLLFNQAFSRGLEISLILAGNKANVDV